MYRHLTIVGLLLALLSTSANAQFFALLARGSITRGVVAATERNMSWLGREVTKAAINQALHGHGPIVQDLKVSSCLLIEFDGRGNYLGNYCNESISIWGFVQQDMASGSVIRIGCRGCVIQPGEVAYYASQSVAGPFLAAEFASSDSRPSEPTQSVRQEKIPTANSASGIETRAIRWTQSDREATLILEILNPSPISIGLVVATRSIFSFAEAQIFTQCGGIFAQSASPYDSFSGISKEPDAPTWIPPQGKITVVMRPNNLRNGVGGNCGLSHATIDAYAFRPGVPNGQPMPIVVIIK